MSRTTVQHEPRPTGGIGLIDNDHWLEPYAGDLRQRFAHYLDMRGTIDAQGGLLGAISSGHHYFGLNVGQCDSQEGIWYREWAPAAHHLALVGDFNDWNDQAHPMLRNRWGTWSLFLARGSGAERLTHASRLMVRVSTEAGSENRIPAYIRRAVQDEKTQSFSGQYWDPPKPYVPLNPAPGRLGGLRIYEAHVGIAPEQGCVGTYDQFRQNVLPRIASLGYNTVQLMAVAEHPYYGSFGYHVSNYFAPSSRFGTPDQLKHLIDAAHGLGLAVIMDVVHSHSVKNVNEGLNRFDGTVHQYFHAPPRGEHPAWDSLCFDYSKYEVRRFLLSNLRYWLEEFGFDGFRFDGVTSMMYVDHGLGRAFASYDDYFNPNVDFDALAYLMLANELTHTIRPRAITIAEDVSGMPGLARPVAENGIGFDYRLAMGIPDHWVKLLTEQTDEQWNLDNLYNSLTDHRPLEKHVGYVESHDQALVGDKTVAFRLMDAEQYWHMSVFSQSVQVDRGIALHKLIRLVTFSLGGQGYLNFMGNEFGHPEWIDFPRKGNGWSYHYARRQWSLVDAEDLRYHHLAAFDRAMQELDEHHLLLPDPAIEQLLVHESKRLLAYRRGKLVFVFNFHPTTSYSNLRIGVPEAADHRIVLDSDERRFAGYGRVTDRMTYPWQPTPIYGRAQSIQIYLPARSAQVMVPVKAT